MADQSQRKQQLESFFDRDELVEKYKYFVYSIVKKIRITTPKTVDFEEMVSYGMIGLMEAADRYDPRRGIAFTTFSYYRIRGAIFDGLRQMGVVKRTSQGWIQREANINNLVQTAADDSDNSKTKVDDQLREIRSLIDKILPAYLLSLSDEATPELIDKKDLPNEVAEMDDLLKLVRMQLETLKPKEKFILEKLYFKRMSTTDLAREMGVTKSWISRLHSKAIERLRRNLIYIGVLPPQ